MAAFHRILLLFSGKKIIDSPRSFCTALTGSFKGERAAAGRTDTDGGEELRKALQAALSFVFCVLAVKPQRRETFQKVRIAESEAV